MAAPVRILALLAGGLLLHAAAFAQDTVPDPEWLRAELEQFRVRAGFPAIAASVSIGDRVVAASVAGVRRHGDADRARQQDRFHIGSIAKPVSVTLFARLADQGFLRWDATVERMFPELAARGRPEYRTVTVAQLVSHTSGMPYEPRTRESETDREGSTARERRRGYVKAALRDAPEAPPGTKSIYGGGHIVVAHHVEELMGEPYESLMRDHVFRPLGMASARFGPPASPGSVDSPWEHVLEGGKPRPVAPDGVQFIQARSPAGRNLTMSIGDLGRFAAAHLAGARGNSRFLKPATFAFLHSPLPPQNVGTSWALGQATWAKGKLLWHSGSTGRNHSLCHVVPEENFAICLATNITFDGAHQRLDELTQALAREVRAGRFGPR
jgi:CubicO group peptidase (beta-lactamase class C family)